MEKVKGREEYETYKKGRRISIEDAVKAKCYNCVGAYVGERDCRAPGCPLYPYMPYRQTDEIEYYEGDEDINLCQGCPMQGRGVCVNYCSLGV